MSGGPFDNFIDFMNNDGRKDKVVFVFVEMDDGTFISFPFGDPAIVYLQLGMAMRNIEQKMKLASLGVTGSA